ncbi:hypothetical protein [Microbacterium sp. Leaf151]|uniref:hypothetical protein n=1 Tax=Microbacterium sp. Leaf151 TaxID=1736276 RepID=UPI000702211D|nr:hypothetical protein [Microbacterium sp. Leaf151]KQR26149.1 hypothetical protein ASF76_02495 [Microbacterium sp. Leaf151]
MKIYRRTALAGAAILLLLLIAPLGFLAETLPLIAVLLTGGALVAGAVWLTRLYFRSSNSVRRAPDFGDAAGDQISVASISIEADYTEPALPASEAARFANMVARPHTYFDRISERVEPLARALDVSTTVTFSVPLSASTTSIVPLLLTNRGALSNGVKITDAQGTRVTSVPQSRLAPYIMAVLRVLVKASRGNDAHAVYRRQIEPDVAKFLVAHRRTNAGLADDIMNRIDTLPSGALTGPVVDQLRETLRDLIRRLVDNHPICVEIAGPDARPASAVDEREKLDLQTTEPSRATPVTPTRLRMTIRQRLYPDFLFHRSKPRRPGNEAVGRTPLDALRVAFGIRQGLIVVPLANAANTRSYHLEVIGPHGSYLARQDIVDHNDGPVEDLRGVRAAPRRGQRHAHLHSVNLRLNNEYIPTVDYRAQFYERMPGSMAAAAAGALSVAVLCVLGLLVAAISRVEGLIGSWEYAAVILAFPVVASLWIGVDGNRQLNQGVLLSRVVSLLSIALACAGAGLNILQIEDPAWWFVLTVASTTNAAAALASWISRARLESYFISRSID